MLTGFRDRAEAGRLLALQLREYAGRSDVLVLALRRGEVPVASEVARTLDAPLDILAVRKLAVPGNGELAFGAIATGSVCALNEDLVRMLGIPDKLIYEVALREARMLLLGERASREGRPAFDLRNRTAILVDDGMATRATIRAAVTAARRLGAVRVVVAAAAASASACEESRRCADECICLTTRVPDRAVDAHDEDFDETKDEEIRTILPQPGNPEARSEVCDRRGDPMMNTEGFAASSRAVAVGSAPRHSSPAFKTHRRAEFLP